MTAFELPHGDFLVQKVSPSQTREHFHEALVTLVDDMGEVAYQGYVWNRVKRCQPFPAVGDRVRV